MVDVARLDELCAALGIALGYTDAQGQRSEASVAGKRHAAAALGLPAETDAQLAESLRALHAHHARPCPDLLTLVAGQASTQNVRGPAEWTLVTETGETSAGRGEGSLALPALPVGYHRLHLQSGDLRTETTIIAAPARCYMPDAFSEGQRGWGVTAQAYSLRGSHDLGLGTYADIGTLADAVGAQGAAFLGLSPLHALFPADASKYSPYSPSSRLFLQTSLIAPHAVAGHAACAENDAPPAPASLIAYASATRRQRHALDAIWVTTRDTATGEIAAFRRAGGERLEEHATFDALSEHFAAQGAHWSGEWPAAFRDVHSAEVAAFRRDHPERIAFHVWLQWLADAQLAHAAGRAQKSGMAVGLYRDLAVGADRGGSEFWSAPERFVATLSVGAPPDPLGPLGQDWGLPPFHPLVLASCGLAAFRELVAANMRHAGALRIDHAFQLQRLFCLPVGGTAVDGVYLSYPLEALLASLKIESHRARCLVIGEDLGTAPDGFSDAMMAAGMLSYRLLPFERGEGGAFKSPRAYPARALAALSTHDLPTFAGWWRGLDVDLRECFGVFDAQRSKTERAARIHDRHALTQALAAERFAVEADDVERPPLVPALRYLARTPCVLTAIQLEDVLRDPQQANLPGPDVGHPNWRRRASAPVAAIAGSAALEQVGAAFAREGRGRASPDTRVPVATYRLQLHKDFTFDDAAAVAPYLAELGVSHVYTSPIQMARPGSTHGYDIVDPTRLNPELGGEAGFLRFSDTLKRHGLRLLVDVVPNHLGVGGDKNPWWLELLEWGRLAHHARTFDVNWDKPGCEGKLIVPFLGSPADELFANGDLALRFDAQEGRLAVWYADHCYPVCPLDYADILGRAHADDAAARDAIGGLQQAFAALASERDVKLLRMRASALKRQLAASCASHAVATALDACAASIASDDLRALSDRQAWRLTFWKDANERINYRRFFDITSLAGMRVEDRHVFEASHRVIFDLIDAGRIDAIRLDHVDGLADPAGYLRRLDDVIGPDFYTVVEKILEPGEHLPPWPIAGTTGYDGLAALDSVFFAADALPQLDAVVAEITPPEDREAALSAIKSELASSAFESEFDVLAGDFAALVPDVDVAPALRAVLAAFPVYRTYGDLAGFSKQDDATLAHARARAATQLDEEGRATLERLLAALHEAVGEGGALPRVVRRFQQLTGPLMAKSFEDTLFYRDARFIAANEVGCGPARPGIDVAEFHRANLERAAHWPTSLMTSATHDTKRGEDARGRLLAASHDMAQWVAAWAAFRTAPGASDIAPNDLYFLFQSLIAACPLSTEEAEREKFGARAAEFSQKFLREGKLRSSWIAPDESYEGRVKDFVERISAVGSVLFGDLAPFIRTIAVQGARLGLARTILKCTVPGVPDIYQGSELSDLAFVDPDNRRPVDYARRKTLLGESFAPQDEALLLSGTGKAFALRRLLADRRAHPATYRGVYEPLTVDAGASVLAYARGAPDAQILVIARRIFTQTPLYSRLDVPAGKWRNLLDDDMMDGGQSIACDAVLRGWPAVVLRRIE